jgi:diguanylate cyclase (GGDEF)-like protein
MSETAAHNPNMFQNDSGLKMYEKKIEAQERKIYDLKNLISLGISLSSNLDFESLVESILYSCIGQMFVDKVAILLQVDIDISSFYIHMTKGYEEDMFTRDIIFREDSPIVQYFLENPDAAFFSDLETLPELKEDTGNLGILEPYLVVPMKSKNLLNGFIILGKKLTGQGYEENDLEFLVDLAKFAAIAVENSRLYLMATLDRMTRLYIHHYFQERLLEEIKRSERMDIPLSLIMSDIDHFKKFNDTYGHQQGDIVLKEVAQIFKRLVRSVDIPARYGGEEFAVILPDTTLEDAIEIATRLRKSVEEHKFAGQDEPLRVTISLGVAQYHADSDSESKGLVKRADAALYRAKESGRNRVVAHRWR